MTTPTRKIRGNPNAIRKFVLYGRTFFDDSVLVSFTDGQSPKGTPISEQSARAGVRQSPRPPVSRDLTRRRTCFARAATSDEACGAREEEGFSIWQPAAGRSTPRLHFLTRRVLSPVLIRLCHPAPMLFLVPRTVHALSVLFRSRGDDCHC